MKKIICSLLVAVLFGNGVCATEPEIQQSTYSKEMIDRFEKEHFQREEKEAFAAGRESLFFLNMHVGALVFFVPTFGVGARYQKGQSGFDMSLDYHTLLIANGLSAKGSYIYYFPHEDFDRQFYMGFGGGGVAYLGPEHKKNNWGLGFGVLTFGKKMGRKTYAQIELLATRIDRTNVMLPTFKFGVGF